MLNQVQNVSQRFVTNRLFVGSTIKLIARRTFSSLSPIHRQLNRPKTTWIQCQLTPKQSSDLRCCFYSTENEQPPDESKPKEGPTPKLTNEKIVVSPPFFSFFNVTFKAMKISNSFDSEFSLDDFIEGSKKAVEVSNPSKLQSYFFFFQNLSNFQL